MEEAFMHKVTVKSISGLQQLVVTPTHSFMADGYVEDQDPVGPSPYELLLSSLAT
jgi:uncharacterized OsmC-like protein|tara:strand:+ start:303 stop:467 length:165 start_codon:yes stop_codon:yes gene_type:complete